MEANHSKPRQAESPTLFNNRLLNFFSRTHIAIPIALFYIYAVAVMVVGVDQGKLAALPTLWTFLLGLLFFTWVEYNMHRYIFHMITNTKLKEKIQYNFHGVHHDYPKDKKRLAMPVPVSILLSTTFFGLFYLILRDYAFGFFPGFIVGYASYLLVHYIVHAFRPPKNLFKMLWVHHGIHHYKRSDKAFGVSSPLWDYIYRTMP